MKFLSLELKNFKATKSATYDFPDTGLSLIIGPNGTGKTTIADGLCFALTGQSVSGRRPKKLLSTLYEDTLSCQLRLQTDSEKEYRVLREVSRRGVASVYVYEENSEEPMPFDSINAVNRFLKDICSKELFFNAIFFSKSSGSFFLELGSQQRKRFLEQLLGLEVYETAEVIAKEESGKIRAELESLEREKLAFQRSAELRQTELLETLARTATEAENLTSQVTDLEFQASQLADWFIVADRQSTKLQELKQTESYALQQHKDCIKKTQLLEQDLQNIENELRDELKKAQLIIEEKLRVHETTRITTEREMNTQLSLLRDKLTESEKQLRKCMQEKLHEAQTAVEQRAKPKLDLLITQLSDLRKRREIANTTTVKEIQVSSEKLQTTEDELRRTLGAKLQFCQTENQKLTKQLLRDRTSLAADEQTGLALAKDLESIRESIRTGICSECKRPGYHSPETTEKFNTKQATLHQLKARIIETSSRIQETEEQTQEMTQYIADLQIKLETDIQSLRKNTEEQLAKLREIAQKNDAEQLQTILVKEKEIEQSRTLEQQEIRQYTQSIEQDLAKTLAELQQSWQKDTAEVTKEYSEQLNGVDGIIQQITAKLQKSRAAESTKMNESPTRLRKLRDVAASKTATETALSEYDLAQKEVLVVQTHYGPAICKEKHAIAQSLKQQIQQLRQTRKERQQFMQTSQAAFKTWEQNELTRIEHEMALVIKKQKIAKFWEKGFSSDGLRSLFLDRVIPEFNRQLQLQSNDISGGNFIVAFERDGKKLKFNAINSSTGSDYDGFSAGEKAMCALIFLTSASAVLSKFEKFSCNLAFFDEVFDALDYYNANMVYDALVALSKKQHVALITHNELFKDADGVDRVIEPHRSTSYC
jgi:exonuclease SbcC